jgi:hypothetical protein
MEKTLKSPKCVTVAASCKAAHGLPWLPRADVASAPSMICSAGPRILGPGRQLRPALLELRRVGRGFAQQRDARHPSEPDHSACTV